MIFLFNMYKYSSLTNHDNKLVSHYLSNPNSKQTHHIQEKLHGAHVSMQYYSDKGWIIHSRNHPLDPTKDDEFHGYKYIRLDLIKKANILREKWGDNIVIHGELIGCLYPEFKINSSFSHFQDKVLYTDKLTYITYDIYEIGHGYWDTTKSLTALTETGFIISPIIASYDDLESALTHNEDFSSTIPNLLLMPPLNIPNKAEGIIIRPERNYYHKNNNRAVIKKKNILFREKNQSNTKLSDNTLIINIVDQYSSGLAGKNRINTVKSKYSEDISIKELIHHFIEDVIQDMKNDGHIYKMDKTNKMIEKKIRKNFGCIYIKTINPSNDININP